MAGTPTVGRPAAGEGANCGGFTPFIAGSGGGFGFHNSSHVENRATPGTTLLPHHPTPTTAAPMLDKLTQAIDFQGKALVMRAERQRNIASNIANADTPGYAARDFKFADAMRDATGSGGTALGALRLAAPQSGGAAGSTVAMGSGAGHIPLTSSMGSLQSGTGPRMDYTVQSQPSMDGNSVDLDRERAAFTDNSVRYEATLRFINGSAKTMLTAIQGQ